MQVKGIQKQEVTVEITTSECIEAIAKEQNLYPMLYHPDYDIRWRAEYDKQGNILALVEEQDISRHGSCCWNKTGHVITDEKQLKLYTHLKALRTILNV